MSDLDLSEKTRLPISFIAWVVIPATVWFAALSYTAQASKERIDRIEKKQESMELFERIVIDRLGRIEEKIDSLTERRRSRTYPNSSE